MNRVIITIGLLSQCVRGMRNSQLLGNLLHQTWEVLDSLLECTPLLLGEGGVQDLLNSGLPLFGFDVLFLLNNPVQVLGEGLEHLRAIGFYNGR